MRALLPVVLALVFAAPALSCDQDYAASNDNRESFMGDAHAAAPPPSASVSATPAPAPAPTPSAALSAAPSAPSGSAAHPAH